MSIYDQINILPDNGHTNKPKIDQLFDAHVRLFQHGKKLSDAEWDAIEGYTVLEAFEALCVELGVNDD